jgi:hypothetical protein
MEGKFETNETEMSETKIIKQEVRELINKYCSDHKFKNDTFKQKKIQPNLL